MYVYVVKEYNRDIYYSERKYQAFNLLDTLKRAGHDISHLDVWRYKTEELNPVPVRVKRD